jgi:hypothetical protein
MSGGRGALWTVVAVLTAAAVTGYGSAALSWSVGPHPAPVDPNPLATVFLAAVPAVIATRRWGRSMVVVVLVASGGVLGTVAVTRSVAERDVLGGPVLGTVSGVLALVAAVLVLRFAARMPRFGTRYRRPGTRTVDGSPDRGMWSQLSAGVDPTGAMPPSGPVRP